MGWALLGLLLGLGCQSIAGVEDVTFDPAGSDCEEYCSTVQEACEGSDVYEDESACRKACAAFPKHSKDSRANTLACRLKNAGFALDADDEIERAGSCEAAGPGGGEDCIDADSKTNCDGYCTLVWDACQSIKTTLGFGSQPECVQQCAALDVAEGGYRVATAKDSGDTLDCRLYYANAAFADPNNCESATMRPDPEGACAPSEKLNPPTCELYCRLVREACQGDLTIYEGDDDDDRQCLATCAVMSEDGVGLRADDKGTDTIGCRIKHAYYALTQNAVAHCPHIGPPGGQVCSAAEDSNCPQYCRLLAAGCAESFGEKFEDNEACIDACEKLPDANPADNAYSLKEARKLGDTMRCRIHQAVRALTTPDEAPLICPAAFGEASPCE